MLVEQWHKMPNEPEKLISVAKVPLHQFHIAFHENQLMEHVLKQRVISIRFKSILLNTIE